MPALNRNEKVKCEEWEIMYIRQNVAPHRKRCAKGVISCPDCKYSKFRFVRLAKKSSHVTTLSNNIGEKNMELNYGSPVIL